MNLFETVLRVLGFAGPEPLIFDRPRSLADWDVTCQRCKSRIVAKKARFRHETQDWACLKCESYNKVKCELCESLVPSLQARYAKLDILKDSDWVCESGWICHDCEQD